MKFKQGNKRTNNKIKLGTRVDLDDLPPQGGRVCGGRGLSKTIISHPSICSASHMVYVLISKK